MQDTSILSNQNKGKSKTSSHYLRVWRWHFYAGLFVLPFLIILAGTGLGMVILSNTVGKQGEQISVLPQGEAHPLSHQAHVAMSSVDGGKVVQYIAPRDDHHVSAFLVKNTQTKIENWVAIDPYTLTILGNQPNKSGVYHTLDNIHSDLLLGKTGDLLLETAASLTILLIVTGIYLWWQKRKNIIKILTVQDIKTKRGFWQEIHGVLGGWLSIVLLFFCITGLAWAGVWGEKMVQAWNQFPAGKWGVEPTPVSTLPIGVKPTTHEQTDDPHAQHHVHPNNSANQTHGEVLNDGTKQVPWVLEKTPMPISTSSQPSANLDIDKIDQMARHMGFVGRYQVNYPKGDKGVWTLSQDSMSYDSPNATADRTVHIDRYSGKVLADIRYADYSAFGKFMALGIALHMGTAGIWSILANIVFCLSVIAICVSGVIMWWKRRPINTANANQPKGLIPPARQQNIQIWWGFGLVLLLIAACFPMALVAIVIISLLDWVIISRVPSLKKILK